MGGSRKGERRGNANPNRAKAGTSAKPPRSPALRKAKGAVASYAADPVLANIVRSQPNLMDKERQVQIYRIASGQNVTLPKEVMLDVMRYFQETAIEYYEVMRANMERAAGATTAEQREVYERAVVDSEARLEKYLILAGDFAVRSAPFLHARLAAIMTGNQPGGGADNPFNVLGLLMKDLDEAGRPARFIDHDPNERAE